MNYSVRRRKKISLLEYFSRRNIIAELRLNARDDIIYELCEVVAEKDESLTQKDLYISVVERENLMGTAIEEGIAVPHARLDFLDRPTVAFGRSVNGVEWNAPDGKLVHFVFLILTPSSEDWLQLQILALIARALKEGRFKGELENARDADEIWDALQRIFAPPHIKV